MEVMDERCQICGSGEMEELLVIGSPDRFERAVGVEGQGYRRAWLECRQCGTAQNRLPPESRAKIEEIRSSYYQIDLGPDGLRRKFEKIMAMPPERSDNAQRVDRVLRFMRGWLEEKDGTWRVMDIGAGLGVFLARLREQAAGRVVTVAVEPDPQAARHLRDIGIERVIEKRFEEAGTALDVADVVTLNKVVEHVPRPIEFLEGAARTLAAGFAYVEVPDKLSVFLRPPDDNILGALHCHLYCPRSLSLLVERAGLEPLLVERIHEPSGKLTVYAFAARPDTVRRRWKK